MHTGIIDRFENRFAIIEYKDGSTKVMKKTRLPSDAQIGDQLFFHDDHSITIDTMGTAQLKKEIDTLADDLFEE
ncbi:DUF3006 domain-containing protein [Kurthia sibirica]|uniref:DUF3006 domain-containing protein n=1 Tax=Kurthia sibirica TaxID=202750 RepID=A0A2U3AHZ2_9BACL|nr:DUF3006 domain-containing protein [Kurthia sibirica]PWI24127.1 DUF3006 domain-containing protein [Kurthia sibirica]GEK35296.1 hypothetical protein KSI01_28290 [Kurthia sibirica]